MLEQKCAQPLVDDVVVGRRDGHAFRADCLQSVDDAVAHRRRAQTRCIDDGFEQPLIERFALIERQRRARELDGFGASRRELLGRRGYPLDDGIEAFGRHRLDAEPRVNVFQAVAVHRNSLLGNPAIERRPDQPQHGHLCLGFDAAQTEAAGCHSRSAPREKVPAFRTHTAPPLELDTFV